MAELARPFRRAVTVLRLRRPAQLSRLQPGIIKSHWQAVTSLGPRTQEMIQSICILSRPGPASDPSLLLYRIWFQVLTH